MHASSWITFSTIHQVSFMNENFHEKGQKFPKHESNPIYGKHILIKLCCTWFLCYRCFTCSSTDTIKILNIMCSIYKEWKCNQKQTIITKISHVNHENTYNITGVVYLANHLGITCNMKSTELLLAILIMLCCVFHFCVL